MSDKKTRRRPSNAIKKSIPKKVNSVRFKREDLWTVEEYGSVSRFVRHLSGDFLERDRVLAVVEGLREKELKRQQYYLETINDYKNEHSYSFMKGCIQEIDLFIRDLDSAVEDIRETNEEEIKDG